MQVAMSDDDSMAHQSDYDSDLNGHPSHAGAGRRRQLPIDIPGRNAMDSDSDSDEDDSDAEVAPIADPGCLACSESSMLQYAVLVRQAET